MSESIVLLPEAIRVLGVLLEKEKATPEYYPMSVNSLIGGCNQKSSRNPVVQYDEATVVSAIEELKKNGLCNTVIGGGSRSYKYKHNISIAFDLNDREEAVLCLLLLRGALTPGEIKSNAGRLYTFSSLYSVIESLDSLIQRDVPLVMQLQRQPGQKESRYIHLLSGVITQDMKTETAHQIPIQSLSERVAALEEEVVELRKKIDNISRLLD